MGDQNRKVILECRQEFLFEWLRFAVEVFEEVFQPFFQIRRTWMGAEMKIGIVINTRVLKFVNRPRVGLGDGQLGLDHWPRNLIILL